MHLHLFFQIVLIEIRGLWGSFGLHLFNTADDLRVCLVCAEAKYFIRLMILAYASLLRSLCIHLPVCKCLYCLKIVFVLTLGNLLLVFVLWFDTIVSDMLIVQKL